MAEETEAECLRNDLDFTIRDSNSWEEFKKNWLGDEE